MVLNVWFKASVSSRITFHGVASQPIIRRPIHWLHSVAMINTPKYPALKSVPVILHAGQAPEHFNLAQAVDPEDANQIVNREVS